jgi:hypothetical protein
VVADFSAETRQQLHDLAAVVDQRCTQLETELQRVDREQRAHLHLDRAFARWEAGRFGGLSPAGRCYVVFEDLRWGHFDRPVRKPVWAVPVAHCDGGRVVGLVSEGGSA